MILGVNKGWLSFLLLFSPSDSTTEEGGFETTSNKEYSEISPISDPEKILKDAKEKQKWTSSSGKSLKTQSKFISKDQVHKYDIKQISSSTVSASEKSVSDLYVQSPIDSEKIVTQV